MLIKKLKDIYNDFWSRVNFWYIYKYPWKLLQYSLSKVCNNIQSLKLEFKDNIENVNSTNFRSENSI